MEKEKIYKRLIPKERNLDNIAEKSIKNPEIVSFLLEGVQSKNVRIRFGCFNTLVLISEQNPEILYPYFGIFAEYLNSDNSIIKLGGIKLISNLSKVDGKNKFDKIFDKFYSFLSDPAMAAAANVSKGSAIIAKAKPYLTENITRQLLKVSHIKYKTEVCKNILIGHVIVTLDKIFNQVENKNEVFDFVELNSDNSWKATKIKAAKFLKKHRKKKADQCV